MRLPQFKLTHYQIFAGPAWEKFDAARDDLAEAVNCVALERPTAGVFHLMRAMEIAVRKLSKRRKVTISTKTTWRVMTHAMDGKIAKMKDKTPAQLQRKNNWEASRANLHHVGSVWRNNTMHPAKSYSQSQAKEILEAVRVFMNGLAEL